MAIKIQNSTIIDDSRNIINAGIVTATNGNFSGIITSSGVNISGASTISVNNSTNALRITQAGTGNAFVVEDSTNPDSTPFVIRSDGYTGIGTTNPQKVLDVLSPDGSGIHARNANNTSSVEVGAVDYDYDLGLSYKGVLLRKYGPNYTGTTGFVGISSANLGSLLFQNTENALIYTNGQTPLILGTFAAEALRIDGLTRNVGLGTTLPTSKLHVVGDTYITGILTANRIISSLYGEFVGGSISGTNIVGTSLSISGISTLGITSTTNLTTQNLNVTGVGTFLSSGLKIRNPANTFEYSIVTAATGANRTLTIPVIAANDTFAFLNVGNTWGNSNTFNNNVTINANTVIQSDPGVPSQTIIIGRSTQTGEITLGLSTVSQTIGISTGASGVGTTKTINFGTGGASGSFTQINVGPTSGVGTVVINSGTRLGIGSAIPTAALDVVGGANVSGNLGVGVTNPSFKTDIAGDVRITSANKMRFGGTAGTTNFYIQYNSTTSSLDFVAG